MKRLFLRRLQISNFMGCINCTIDFTNNVTTISGDNATGKSTLEAAHLWLLTGKNKSGETDFNIKNTVKPELNRQEHTVTEVYDITECGFTTSVTLTKTYREKYVKKEYVGNENIYFINDVPIETQREFKQKLDNIIPEKVLRLITNVDYFCNLDTKEMREILFSMCPEINDVQVAKTDNRFADLLQRLNGKTFVEFRSEIAAKKLKIKKELDTIPARISELYGQIAPVNNIADVTDKINTLNAEKALITKALSDSATAMQHKMDERIKQVRAKGELQRQLNDIQMQLDTKHNEQYYILQNKVRTIKDIIESLTHSIAANTTRINQMQENIKQLEKDNEALRQRYHEINEEPQPELDVTTCPTCKQDLPQATLDAKLNDLIEDFNANKVARLEANNQRGIANKQIITQYEADVAKLKEANAKYNETIFNGKNECTQLEAEMVQLKNTARKVTTDEIKFQEIINAFVIPDVDAAPNNAELESKLRSIQEELDACNQAIGQATTNTSIEKRITELKANEELYAQEIANLEKEEYIMREFTKVKVNYVEQKVNSMFKYTTFKMYEDVISNPDNPKEVCIPMYKGVPYSATTPNTAGKVNMGLDIINVLSAYMGYSAPIFIDDADLVHEFIPTTGQLIKLQVSHDKTLQVQ